MSDRNNSNNALGLLLALGTAAGVSMCCYYKNKHDKKVNKKNSDDDTEYSTDKTYEGGDFNDSENEYVEDSDETTETTETVESKEQIELRKQGVILGKFDGVIKELQEQNKELENRLRRSNGAIAKLEKELENTRNTVLSNNVRLQKLEMQNPECSFFDNHDVPISVY